MNKTSESDTVKYVKEKVTDEKKMIWIEEDVFIFENMSRYQD
jgi:hypothetical protein